jgi:YfiR/HmsC-like
MPAHRPGPLLARRGVLGAFAAVLLGARRGQADDLVVPPDLQAELLIKVAPYDRNFAARAGELARVLVMTRPNDAASLGAGVQFERALSRRGAIGSVKSRIEVRPFAGAPALKAICTSDRVSIVYFSTGFGAETDAIADGLSGLDLLSVAATPELVQRRMVLGFELTSGRPKLLVNLAQARRQNVAFRAEVLKLMKVYE